MTPADDMTRLAGVYILQPEQMLQHSIELALQVSCCMASTEAGKRRMFAIGGDAALSARASMLIMRHMLRGLITNRPPTPADFERLVREVAALATES